MLHLTASDPQGYPVTITGSAGGTPIDCVGSCSVALPAGQGTAAYSATSSSGQTASGSTAWKYDPDAPSLFISAAGNSNGAWFKTDVQLNATATDAISGVLPPTVSLDDGSPVSLPKSIHFDGIYSAEFSVLDNAGNITTRPFSFKIDQTPPDLWWRMDTSGAWTGPVLLHGTYGDLLSGTQRVEISTDNGLTWQTAALSISSLSWDYPWQTEDLPNGPRAVLARASDLAGNNSAPISIGLTLNNHPPLVDLASSWYVWESGGLWIASNITPLASVEIIVRDPLLRYPTTSIQASVQTRVVTWDRLLGPYLAPDGDYSVSVRVCDIYGLCATDSGVIHIPVTAFTPTPAPLLDPIIVPPAPTPIVVPPDGQVILLTWPEDAPSPQPVPFNPLPALLALLALLFLAAFATLMILHDPRPVALQHLAQAIEPGLFTRKTPSTD